MAALDGFLEKLLPEQELSGILVGVRSVAFEEARVRDTATFAEPVSYPEGIEYVVVGGSVAVTRREVSHVRSGRVIRG